MVPVLVDVYGGLGEEAYTFMGQLVKSIAGKREGWQRRMVEASVWQQLCLTLVRELGRQLAWHVHAGAEGLETAEACHAPYLD